MEIPRIIAEHLPIGTTVGTLIVASVIGAVLWPWAAVSGVYASLVFGQLIRLPVLGQGGGLLLSDIAVGIYLACVFVALLRGRIAITRKSSIALCAIVPFIIWTSALLMAYGGVYEKKEVIIMALYWVRLVSILLLLPATVAIASEKKHRTFLRNSMVWTYGLLLISGYLQILIVPRLEGVFGGWDPHQYRMVGTWFDPNFFGLFLAMLFPVFLHWTRGLGAVPVKIFYGAIAGLGILLTQSRSTYLSIGVGAVVCGLLWIFSATMSRKIKSLLIVFVSGLCVVLIVMGMSLQDRALGILTHDPTISLRTQAYEATWHRLVEHNLFLGVGYNAYQFVAQDAGLISDFSIHSRAGSDSSFITLLVTTGIVGLTLFIIPIGATVAYQLILWICYRKLEALLFIWTTVVLLVQSQITNSLLYPHILIPYLLLSALLL